ncbi:hypothetical protein [Kitasatospora purpeofusca]|uniref:hypothetical protein n=1 Tax=Kitasatospora purpeofusca TaxID=67352 RepID=UPI0038308647
MRFRTLLAAVALAATTVPAVALGAGTAQAVPLLCGTLAANYAGHTYVTASTNSLDDGAEWVFNSDGTLSFPTGLVFGSWTVNVNRLTAQSSTTTYTSSFRGCDGSLTTPGFVSLSGTDLNGDTEALALTLRS